MNRRHVVHLPFLLKYLATCRPKDVTQYAEKILAAGNAANKKALLKILRQRLVDLKPSQLPRVKKIIKAAEEREMSFKR